MNSADVRLILIISSIIFNFGGFFWLAKNHFHSVNKRLDAIEEKLHLLDLSLARIKAICERSMQ